MGNFMTAKVAFDDLNFYSKVSKTTFHPHSSPGNTLIILDWDDTLMCTTFISLKKDTLSNKEMSLIFFLGERVSHFLMECKKFGKVIILTNSAKTWVNSTSEKMLKIPKDVSENIEIISARDKYVKESKSKKEWKKLAMEELIDEYKKANKGLIHLSLNLLCISDSSEDIKLFKNIKEKFNEWIFLSTVKLKEKPSPLVMINQIQFMTKNLNKVIGKNGNYFLDNDNEEEKSKKASSSFNKSNENVRTLFNLSLFGI